jgi:hypothetical protein
MSLVYHETVLVVIEEVMNDVDKPAVTGVTDNEYTISAAVQTDEF